MKSSFLAQRLVLGLLLATSVSAQPRNGRPNSVPAIERPSNPIEGQYIFTFDETEVTPEEVQPIRGSISRVLSCSNSRSQCLVRAKPDWLAAFEGL